MLTRMLNPSDWVAGLSIAGLLLPEAVAYSRIGNLPMQSGIVALFAGLLCYGVLGNSRFAIVSATSSSAALLAASVLPLTGEDATLRMVFAYGLVMVTGMMFIVAAMAKVGSITDFIAKPVLRGFSFALAFVITVHQFALFVDVKPTYTDVPRYVFVLIGDFFQWNWFGFALGVWALFLIQWLSRYRYVPAGLIVIALGILLGYFSPLSNHGIHLIGNIDIQLNAPSVGRLSYSDWMRLLELGVAMLLIVYAESYSSIRTFATKHKDEVDPNRDLFALGVSNLVSGAFHGMPVGAGYSATAANESAGAASRWAGLVAALCVLMMLLFLLPWLAYTPEPILAAIVIHAVSHSLSLNKLKPYFKWQRDRFIVLFAIGSVLVLGILDGLLVAIGISLLMTLKRFSSSSLSELGCYRDGHDYLTLASSNDVHTIPNILILRPNEPLFFANIERVVAEIQRRVKSLNNVVVTVILSLEETPDLDSTTLESLNELMVSFEHNHNHLILARLKEAVYELLTQGNGATPWQHVALSRLSVSHAVKQAQQTMHSNTLDHEQAANDVMDDHPVDEVK
ncbi:putative sulfate transporter [Ephemeroptericola cinctiostellae]|uniref:Putative sulfate transporter n=2 Tax=Ephemeroptericola cinctiostellae TaxID=2268024 RepID=A0A345DBX2_9BURK|nr:putative sulfate transporter [Ephemeroptericola cinctiostellae]